MGILDQRRLSAEKLRIEIRSVRTTKLLDYSDVIAVPSEQLTRRIMDILATEDVTHGQRTYAIIRNEKGATVGLPFGHLFSYESRAR